MNRREQRGCRHCEDCSVLQDYVLSAAHDNTVQSVLVGGSHKCPCKGSSQTNPPPTPSIIPVPAIVHKKRIIPELSAVLNEDGAPCPLKHTPQARTEAHRAAWLMFKTNLCILCVDYLTFIGTRRFKSHQDGYTS